MTFFRKALVSVALATTLIATAATATINAAQFIGVGQAEGATLNIIPSAGQITATLTDPDMATVNFSLTRVSEDAANGGFTLNGVSFGVHMVQGAAGQVDLFIVPASAPTAENASVYSFVTTKPWFLSN